MDEKSTDELLVEVYMAQASMQKLCMSLDYLTCTEVGRPRRES